MTRPWKAPRGLARLLSQETNVSDFLQMLSDLDPQPWKEIVGFAPTDIVREARLAGNADLLLSAPDQRKAIIELKLGHLLSKAQQEKYEKWEPEGTDLYLVALKADAHRVSDEMRSRWSFVPLADLFGRWADSGNRLACALTSEITHIIQSWDDLIDSVFRPGGASLDCLTAKFPTRAVSRRMAADLESRGRAALAGVSSGGGLPVVQAWARVDESGTEEKWFIAEVRWWEDKVGGELRFGVDYHTERTPQMRREAYELARSMSNVIDAAALAAHLRDGSSDLAAVYNWDGSGRPAPRTAAGYSWDDVVEHGLGSAHLSRNGQRLTRLSINPGFHGDKDLRFEALAALDFTRLNAVDVVELLDKTLDYLQQAGRLGH